MTKARHDQPVFEKRLGSRIEGSLPVAFFGARGEDDDGTALNPWQEHSFSPTASLRQSADMLANCF
jgi:hypothetical protein